MDPALIRLLFGVAASGIALIAGAFYIFHNPEQPHGERPAGERANEEPRLDRCCSCDEPIEDRPANPQRRRFVLPTCGHVYHWACLQRLNETTRRCAFCGRPFHRFA